MTTSLADLERWFDAGVRQNATHMIVVCDLFVYVDYPIYVAPGSCVEEKVRDFQNRAMSKVTEVYALWKPGARLTLAGARVWDLDSPPERDAA